LYQLSRRGGGLFLISFKTTRYYRLLHRETLGGSVITHFKQQAVQPALFTACIKTMHLKRMLSKTHAFNHEQ
jgi:hypothetical protein